MKTSLMIFCRCHFTRLGLEYAIAHHPMLTTQLVVSSLFDSRVALENSPTKHVVVLVLDQHIGFWLIQQINERVMLWDDKINVILIKPQGRLEGMVNYLQEIMNVRAVLNVNAEFRTLQYMLLSILEHPTIPEKNSSRASLSQLSIREKIVIKNLLRGRKVSEIAIEQGVGYKTVHSQKLTALKKLRVRSLQRLVLGL